MDATFETELAELIAKWKEAGTRAADVIEALTDAYERTGGPLTDADHYD